jgi:hypothetical protein
MTSITTSNFFVKSSPNIIGLWVIISRVMVEIIKSQSMPF